MTDSVLILTDAPLAKPKKIAKPKKAKRPRATTTDGHYVTNATLLPEILKAQELGYVTPKLAEMYQKIAERFSRSRTFAHLSFREDMVSAAVLNLIQNGLKFNPQKTNNPFSYLTQCCYHSFLQVIADEKKQREIRDTMLLDSGMNASNTFMERGHDEYRANHQELFND